MSAIDSASEYFRQHSALSNWLSASKSDSATGILLEDASRAKRLRELSDVIGLPIMETWIFSGSDVSGLSPAVSRFCDEATGKYAVRVLDRDRRTVLGRNRNLSANKLVEWARSSFPGLEGTLVEFSVHIPNEYSAILASTPDGTVGEVIRGSLRQLTQNGPGSGATRVFATTGEDSEIVPAIDDDDLATFVRTLLTWLTVIDEEPRIAAERLGCEFSLDNRLLGYFEAIQGPGNNVFFVDYNRALGHQLQPSFVRALRRELTRHTSGLSGIPSSPGKVKGVAQVLLHPDEDRRATPDGAVLVCSEPSPSIIQRLRHASALVADRGGVLAHASILCRELGIPCVVGAGNATELIAEGDLVTVNGDTGAIRVHRRD